MILITLARVRTLVFKNELFTSMIDLARHFIFRLVAVESAGFNTSSLVARISMS